MTTQLSNIKRLCTLLCAMCYLLWFKKEIVIESLALTDMTSVTSAVLFRYESKGSGFHANERL